MTRRMMLVVLAVMGVMVLVVTAAPPDPRVEDSSRAPRAPQGSGLDAFDVKATLSADPGRRAETIEAALGDRVEIVVEGGQLDSVSLGEVRFESIDEDLPARFELLAETRGSYPLVLVNEDRRIGSLEIR